jgi:hypothetical protein
MILGPNPSTLIDACGGYQTLHMGQPEGRCEGESTWSSLCGAVKKRWRPPFASSHDTYGRFPKYEKGKTVNVFVHRGGGKYTVIPCPACYEILQEEIKKSREDRPRWSVVVTFEIFGRRRYPFLKHGLDNLLLDTEEKLRAHIEKSPHMWDPDWSTLEKLGVW